MKFTPRSDAHGRRGAEILKILEESAVPVPTPDLVACFTESADMRHRVWSSLMHLQRSGRVEKVYRRGDCVKAYWVLAGRSLDATKWIPERPPAAPAPVREARPASGQRGSRTHLYRPERGGVGSHDG